MALKDKEVFRCPLLEKCRMERDERHFIWADNEPFEIWQVQKCPVPFLKIRSTGETVCRLFLEEGEWKNAVKDIGRARDPKKKREKNQFDH